MNTSYEKQFKRSYSEPFMTENHIPFEIHLTTEDLSFSRESDFLEFCSKQNAKPILIELSRGSVIKQPMLSKVVTASKFNDVLSAADKISQRMIENHFPVKRLKIEVPSVHAEFSSSFSSGFKRYYECHLKLHLKEIDNLLKVCERHGVHLSSNSLRNDQLTRFVTLREFSSKEIFEERVSQLKADLESGSWEILKQEMEYCIYDSNAYLDNGWLQQ